MSDCEIFDTKIYPEKYLESNKFPGTTVKVAKFTYPGEPVHYSVTIGNAGTTFNLSMYGEDVMTLAEILLKAVDGVAYYARQDADSELVGNLKED